MYHVTDVASCCGGAKPRNAAEAAKGEEGWTLRLHAMEGEAVELVGTVNCHN